VKGNRVGELDCRKMANTNNEFYDSEMSRYTFSEDEGEIFMVRASACKYFVAIVYKSIIRIEKPAIFLKRTEGKSGLKITTESSMMEAEFKIKDSHYTYLEWPLLSQAYIEKPYFLTLDDKGILKIHSIKEGSEEIVKEEDEKYHCACFSIDGNMIYAINKKQEFCMIDFKKDPIVLSKRKISGIDDPNGVISKHIIQITPCIIAVGSLIKVSLIKVIEGSNETFKPFLHIFCGEISDLSSDLKIKEYEIPWRNPFSRWNIRVGFRSLYIKERQLLLFGHTGSNKVRAFNFDFDGSINEIEGPDLGNKNLQGIVLGREPIPSKIKNGKVQIGYQSKLFNVSGPLHIFTLDSKRYICHFYYCDTRLLAPAFSMFLSPTSIKQFYDLDQDQYLMKKLTAKMKKSRHRCKSQDLKKKESGKLKRENSCISLGVGGASRESTFSSEEKQKKILQLKIENREKKVLRSPSSLSKAPNSSLFNLTTMPLFNMDRKTEEKLDLNASENLTGSGLFSVPTANLFSGSTPSSSSLFGTSNKTSSLFQKALIKPTQDEPENGLFSVVVKKSTQPEKDTSSSNLFSAAPQSKSFLQVFQMPEDPMKKKAFLFLNKHESDVVFKVENEEFPAHKYILSEKCQFFKTAFTSGMMESNSSMIEIQDTKASIFKAFLEYVYLGKTVMNEELALSLLDLSEKYMISDLKAACESCLQKLLTLDNCIKMFETAYFYDAVSLKKWTLFFFQMNLKNLMGREDFEDLPKMSYLHILKINWNQSTDICPPLSQLVVK